MTKKERIKTENMTALSEYRAYLRRHPRLTYLFVELTDRCNLACLHCGSSCSQTQKQYIDTGALIKTLTEVAEDYDPQRVMICLTGGEPLLHPDFYEIVESIVRLNFPWGMTTNGTLIDKKTAEHLKALNIGSITVSIDGLKEHHEWLRNNNGCFARALEGIKNLTDLKIPVQVTTVIHKKNIDSLEEIFEFMSGLNLVSWRAINLEPIGRAMENRELLLSYSEMLKLLDFIREKRYSTEVTIDVRFGCSHYLSFEYEHEVRDNYFICGAGIYVGSILCNGDIYSCLDIERRRELVQGNIFEDRFSYVWENKFKEFRADRAELSERCKGCKERAFCNGDSMHTWDFDKNQPMVCMLREENLYEC